MRKIKKNDPRTDQTVFAFACPCASCSISSGFCDCREYGYDSVSWRVVNAQAYNRAVGGSLVGGGG